MEFITEIVILLSLFILLLFLEPLGCFFCFINWFIIFFDLFLPNKKKIKKLGLLRAVAEKNLYNNTKGTLSGLKEIFKSYKKKYPEILSERLNINLAKNIAKDRMDYNFIKSPDELKNILGWNSTIKIFLAKIISIMYKIKYRFIISNIK